MGVAASLKVAGRRAIRVWHAVIDGEEGSAERHFCRHCGCALWVSHGAEDASVNGLG